MPNVITALPNIGGALAAVWLTPTTRVPCSNAAKTQTPVEICRGAPNARTELSRYWADVHHIVRNLENILVLNKFYFGLSNMP